MPKIAYVNGRYLDHMKANVHIEDRGLQFADGVYEVILVRNQSLVDIDLHLSRLDWSLSELKIDWPKTPRVLSLLLNEIIYRNRLTFGSIYIQVSRGTASRNFDYPEEISPNLIIYAKRATRDTFASINKGYKVISMPDIRWKRCDLKTVSLLPAVLAKKAAVEQGAMEAWLVDEHGLVTEGTSSNAWIVSNNDELITRPVDHSILSGVTRKTVASLAKEIGIKVIEQAFSIDDAIKAKEAFCTSSTALLKPITNIDGKRIGDGKVGNITKSIIIHYLKYMDD